MIDSCLRPHAAGKADGQDSPPPVDAPHRLIEHAAAYRVVDDVSAASVCERFNRFAETAEFAILKAVIDDVIRTARLNTR